ncbi:hypothetical protein WT25_20205 [Burkholderia territorii]|uniref:hypothetical protein n=1 Tax=Burkholderia territorii TaxID=1503055 RepID=UPI000758DBBD|nr:hypothetical protein [Burkholderia territorii]KVT78860.1 hypothetical protein WT25_20205 [Burkholderia territorii]
MNWKYVAAATAFVTCLFACVGFWIIPREKPSAPVTRVERPVDTPMADNFTGASLAASKMQRIHRPLPVRVTEHIASEYASSAATREALTQIAYGWDQAVLDVKNAVDAKNAGNAIAKGIACALSQPVLDKSGVNQQTMLGRIKDTRAVMLDTVAATQAYIRFQSLAGGQYFNDPGANSCDFDPSTLQN